VQGSGLAWLFPFVNGQPPVGWHDAIAYLVLPVLLIASQYASQKLVTPQSDDPAQKQTQAILGFLPFMIGEQSSVCQLYSSCCVPTAP
jgi:YidC/Oxa1 family membrane protein insertase